MGVASTQPVFPPPVGTNTEGAWAQAVAEHVVQRFANVTARDAGWTSPPAGAMAATVSDHKLWMYSGTAWLPVAIQGVDSVWYPGEIRAGLWTVAPTGWLLMNGQSILNANGAYPALWAVAPAAWKGGTTLNIPNMSGRVFLGGGVLGTIAGAMTHTLTELMLPPHAHAVNITSSVESQTHTHSINHDHASFNTAVSGGHGHSAGFVAHQAGTGAGKFVALQSNDASAALDQNIVKTDGAHQHSIDIPTYVGSSQTESANHSHNVVGVTGNGAGTSALVDHTPAHVRINYIIRAVA